MIFIEKPSAMYNLEFIKFCLYPTINKNNIVIVKKCYSTFFIVPVLT